MEYKKVSELCEIKTGKYDANHAVENGKYLFYTCAMYPSKANTYSFEGNLIMLPGNGANLGEVMYYEGKIEAYQRTYVLYNVKCNSKYLYHYLRSMWKRYIFKRQVGSATNYMKLNDISELEIPLPSLNVQDKIASALDKAQEIIDKRNKQIVELDELIKSRFIEMFGDPVKNPNKFPVHSLMDCYDRNDAIKCGPFGSALKKHEYTNIGIPVWNMDNISKKCEFFDTPNLWITNEKYETLKNYETKNGDIIISRAGTVGKMSVVKSVYDKSIISTNLIRLRLNEKILPIYFIMLINIFGNKVCRLQTGSDGAFTHMNTGVLNSIEIPLPPIELQNEFVYFLEQVDKLKFEMENSLKELEDNFNSLMQRAFKGALFND